MGLLSWLWPWKKTSKVMFPRVIFDCLPGGRIEVTCDWPDSENQDQLIGYARGLAGMLFYINDGQLTVNSEQAVAIAGYLKKQDRLAEHVINLLRQHRHKAMMEEDESFSHEHRTGPVVPADEVFNKD